MTATYASVTSLPKGRRPNIKKLPILIPNPIRIFSLGGSWSADYDDTGSVVGSYRYHLHEMATSRGGLTLDWLGCRAGGPAGHPSRPTHALAGASCQQWLNTIPGGGVGSLALGSPPQTLSSYLFDVGFLETILNTANSNTETATWRADQVDLVTEIFEVRPSSVLVLFSPFDGGPDVPRRANLATMRGWFADVLDDLYVAGYYNKIVPCDIDVMHRDVDMDPNEPKGGAVHPAEDRGALKAASAAFPALMNATGRDAVH